MEYNKEQFDALLKRLETAEAVAKDAAKKEVDSLKETNAKLITNVNDLTTQLTTAKEDAKKLTGELTAAKELAKSHEDTATKLAADIKQLEESLAKAKDEMDKYHKEMCKSKRKSAMAQIDVDEKRADELIEKLSAVSDEIFDEFVKNMPKKKTDTSTASLKDALKSADVKDINVTVTTDNVNTLVTKASEWFASALSSKNKGE